MVSGPFTRGARLGDRLLGFFGVRLAIWLITAKAFLPGVLGDAAWNIGPYHDEHKAVAHEEAARISLAEHHQLPAWNPYYCGGEMEVANAESNVWAPDFLLRLEWGTLPGRRLAVLLFVVLGMEGTWRLARKSGASALGGAMAGVAFACSGFFVRMLGWGWVFMFNFNLVPWCLYAYQQALARRWWIVGGGAFMAWIILGGGTYVAPYTAIALALLCLYETVRGEVKRWVPVATLAATAAVAVGLCAVRLFPMVDFLLSHGRPVDQKDQMTPLGAIAMLAFDREHGTWGPAAGEFYVGTWVFLLAALALLLADKRAAKMWALAVVFGALSLGEFTNDAPYLLLRKLPLFSQLRFPMRMLMIAALFVSVAGAIGVTRLEDLVPRLLDRAWARFGKLREKLGERPSRRLRLFVGVAAFAFGAWLAHEAAADVVEANAMKPGTIYILGPPLAYADPFRMSRGNRWDAYVWPWASRGSMHCFEEQEFFESPYLRGDLPQEEYGAPGTDTKVERLKWSPHEIVLRVTSTGPGRFLVNQNHHSAWKADIGELDSDGGIISVKVPPGEHVVTLTFSDGWLRFGGLVTFATSLAIAIAAVKSLRRRSRRLVRSLEAIP